MCKRKSLCIVLVLSLMLAAFTTFVPAKVSYQLGDANADGSIDTDDARLLMRGITYGRSWSRQERELGDLDGDLAVTTTDVRRLLNRIVTAQEDVLPLAGFEDLVDASSYCTYVMRAQYTDTYTFSCTTAVSLCVDGETGTVSGAKEVTKRLVAGELCTVTVKARPGTKVTVSVTGQDYTQRLPYDAQFTVDADTLDTVGDPSVDPLSYASLSYSKRDGGTYIYANNPEKLQAADIGQALLQTEHLTGDVQFTYEHSNFTGRSVYLGYQLKNDSDTDVFVTVMNIGMQVQGEWLGQQSWSDYYNYQFDLPSDYFNADGTVSKRYEGQDFIDYTPRVYQPMTYRIPAGQYIYVLGGTTADAYLYTNIASTADQIIYTGKCSNGVVKFSVFGGEVTGTFYCYTDVSQVMAEPTQQGYIVDRNGVSYGLQYKGVDYHQGLVESNMIWYVNDQTPAQDLPVTYESSYDRRAYRTGEAYASYDSTSKVQYKRYWITNINPQSTNGAVGSDMMSFECVTTDGTKVTIDTEHADAYGTPANLGNWMVDYHDNMTFVNQGDSVRSFTINKYANGALMAMVLDNKGDVLATKCTIVPIMGSATDEQWELYTVEVPAHSVVQVTVSYLLMGNSYGNVRHWVTLH